MFRYKLFLILGLVVLTVAIIGNVAQLIYNDINGSNKAGHVNTSNELPLFQNEFANLKNASHWKYYLHQRGKLHVYMTSALCDEQDFSDFALYLGVELQPYFIKNSHDHFKTLLMDFRGTMTDIPCELDSSDLGGFVRQPKIGEIYAFYHKSEKTAIFFCSN